jgi:hypothetical protein
MADRPRGSPRQMLWVVLSPSTWLLALDGHLTHPAAWQIEAARVSMVTALVFALIFFEVTLPIHDHWCCYPSGTDIDDEDRGLCTNASAPIQAEARDCGPPTHSVLFWVSLALWLVPMTIWAVLTAVRLVELNNDLKRSVLGDAEYVTHVVQTHGVDETTADAMHEAVELLRDPRETLWSELDHKQLKSAALVSRAWIYVVEPAVAAAFFALATVMSPYAVWDLTWIQWLLLAWVAWTLMLPVPAIVGALPAWHLVVSVLSTMAWMACAACAALLVLPDWRARCCHSDRLPQVEWVRLPSCADMPWYLTDAMDECGVGSWTWQLWTTLIIGAVTGAVSVVNYIVLAVTYMEDAAEMEERWIAGLLQRQLARTNAAQHGHKLQLLQTHVHVMQGND